LLYIPGQDGVFAPGGRMAGLYGPAPDQARCHPSRGQYRGQILTPGPGDLLYNGRRPPGYGPDIPEGLLQRYRGWGGKESRGKAAPADAVRCPGYKRLAGNALKFL